MDVLSDPTLSDRDRADIIQARTLKASIDAGRGVQSGPSKMSKSTQSAGSVAHAFHLLVAGQMQKNGGDRRRAIRTVARQEPGLYEQYIKSLPKGGPQLRK